MSGILFALTWPISTFLPYPLLAQENLKASSEEIAATRSKVPLHQAVQNALETNLVLKNLQLETERFALEAQQSAKQKLFTLSGLGNYFFKSQTPFLELPISSPLAGGPSPLRIEGGLKHNYEFGLAVNQPVFTGGRLSTTAQLYRSGELAAAHQVSLYSNQIASTVKLLYFNYHRLQAQKNSLLALKEKLSFHEKKTESLVEAQLARRLNLVETKEKIEELTASLLDLEQSLEAVRVNFHRLSGYFPEDIEADYQEPEISLEEALAYFEQNHPQFRIFQERTNQLELQKKIVRASNWPQISAVAELHYGQPGLNFFKKEWSFYATAGLAIQFRLFDWQQSRSEIEILSLAEQKIQNEKEDFILETKQELEKLFAQKKILSEKLKHLQAIISLAEEEVKLKEQLSQENLLPHLDYLAALHSLEQNKWAQVELLFQIEEIKLKIHSLIGQAQKVEDYSKIGQLKCPNK